MALKQHKQELACDKNESKVPTKTTSILTSAETDDEHNNKDNCLEQQQQCDEQYYNNEKHNGKKIPEHCNGESNAAAAVIKYNRSESKKTQASLFELVYEIIGEKEQRTKEMGTLIRKYMC